jgi:hypothetical protein
MTRKTTLYTWLATLFLTAAANAGEVPFSIAQTIDATFTDVTLISTVDMDGDGDLDVLSASRLDDEVAWWENTTGDGTVWVKQLVDGAFNGAKATIAADLDGDGDLDVVATAMSPTLDVAWWENTAGDLTVWSESPIQVSFRSGQSLTTPDLDGDGDLDILAVAKVDGDVTWWKNDAGDGTSWSELTFDGSFDRA